MNKRRNMLLIWALALIPVAVTAALYGALPERIPMHWGVNGSIRYDPKQSIWLMVLLGPLFAFLFPLLPKIDPRGKNYEKFSGVYLGFLAVMELFLLIVNLVVLSESLYPGRISVSTLIVALTGLLLTYIGNILPKAKSNFFFGFRNPWTLSDPDVWNKANRLGGFLLFFGGALIAVMPFLLSERQMFAALLAIVLATVLVPTVMSYVWYRRAARDE